MKLKLIAAVAGLIFSAASQAAIAPATTIGGSDVLLDVWEQGAAGAPDQSFTLDLGMSLTAFVNGSKNSSTLATLLSTDSTWSNFLSSSSSAAGDLQWSVVASGAAVPSRAGLLASVTTSEDAVGFGMVNQQVIFANQQLAPTIDSMNLAANPNEQSNVAPSGAYYQNASLSNFNNYSWDNGNVLGATGVQVAEALNVGGSGTKLANTTLLNGTLSFVQNPGSGSYVLSYNVAAVPEMSGFGMALAGLFAMGFVALRRKNA